MGKKKETSDSLIGMYRDMFFYRKLEEKINLAYTKQKFSGFCHLHIGQEALCVGVQKCLRPSDYMISGYRSHTQAVAKGVAASAVFAELYGKVDGCSRGKGGSMHMFSKEHRFLGGHGIVGGQGPLATGVAFALKYQNFDDVMICYLGDAAMNQGAVFEAMNMAATWSLPVLYIIENNQYGMGTAITRTTSVEKLSKRALAFDMDHSEVDGMDVLAVQGHVLPLVESMRKNPRPHLLEAHTYRYKGHSVSDPGTYRTKEEVSSYQDKDPIKTLKEHLLKKKYASEEDLKKIENAVKQELKEAEEKADAAPYADEAEVHKHIFA